MTKKSILLSLLLLSAAGPALAGDLTAGKIKAEAVCQTCHGLDGRATVPMAAHLSGQQKQYLVIQMRAYRSGQRRHEQMDIVAKTLSDADIENLAEWYSAIKVTVEMPR